MNVRIPDKWKFDKTLEKILDKDQSLKDLYNKNRTDKVIDKSDNEKMKKMETFFYKKDGKNEKSLFLSSYPLSIRNSKDRNSKTFSNNSDLKTTSQILTSSITSSEVNSTTDPNMTESSKESKVTVSLPKIKIAKKTNSENNYGPFLNITGFEKKIEIKNPLVKKLLDDTKNHGPYYTHCPSCQNKNLSFFQHLKEKEALKIITYIKEEKLHNGNKKVCIKTKFLNQTQRGIN
jgi:hypothetical protein